MRPSRGVTRLALRIAVLLLTLVALPLVLLAFPQILMHRSARSGNLTIYYDGAHDPYIDDLATEVHDRLGGSALYDAVRRDRVFFIRGQALYTFFARLARVPPKAQGFALSVLGNAYVSETNVSSLGARTRRLPKYSVWEGSPAHTIAHELAHLALTDTLGRDRWRGLPHWKREGLPEYIANIGAIRVDDTADLRNRALILLDDRNWTSPRGWDRIHYEAGLLVEFALEVRGSSLRELVTAAETREETLDDLLAWTESRG